MKTLPLLMLSALLITSDLKAQSCNIKSDDPVVGVVTKECMNEILFNYITYFPTGFFVITVSEQDNVYVQGSRSSGNTFIFETVGSRYSDKVSVEVMQKLLKLGWSLPSEQSGNFELLVSAEQILDGQAVEILLETITIYDLQYNGQNLTYMMWVF